MSSGTNQHCLGEPPLETFNRIHGWLRGNMGDNETIIHPSKAVAAAGICRVIKYSAVDVYVGRRFAV